MITIPDPTEPPHVGSTFHKPPPQRSMWQDEIDDRHHLRLWAYAFAFVASILASGIVAALNAS